MALRKTYCLLSLLCGFYSFPQGCTIANFQTATRIPASSFPYFSVSSGITVSVTTNCGTLSNVTYSCGGINYAGASPSWWLNASNQYIIFKFSAPVSKFTVLVNGTNQTEVFYFASNGGSPTITDYCSPDMVASANTVTDVVSPTIGAIISANVTSATNFTLTHNGLGSGSRVTLLDCFVPATVLPVELISFDADCISRDNVSLTWKTANELHNDHFTIERSVDAFHWIDLKNFPAGNSSASIQSYSFTDFSAQGELLYYRLKQTDHDGHYKHSGIVTVKNCSLKNEVEVYPNPASNELTVSGRFIESIQLFNLTGTQKFYLNNPGSGKVKIDLSEFPAGIYFLKVGDKNYKIVKQ